MWYLKTEGESDKVGLKDLNIMFSLVFVSITIVIVYEKCNYECCVVQF